MSSTKPSSDSIPSPISYITTEKKVIQECLRQAHWSFNLAIALTTASAFVGIVGIGFLLNSKISEKKPNGYSVG